MPERYDAIIIGSGQGGGPLSSALVKAGRRTAIIEREHIGGTCINVGCTPTKTMVASARVAHIARSAAAFGVNIEGAISLDMRRVRQRKQAMVESFRSGSESATESGGAEIVRGTASFLSPREILISGDGPARTLEADLIVIDTGGRPLIPHDVEGLGSVPYLDSTTIMELSEVPDHLLILGGGYVGVEFGQMFRRFGSRVTIVQNGPALLANEDSDVAEAVAKLLRDDGIEILVDATATRAFVESNGISLAVASKGGDQILEGSHLLVAVGRKPNTEFLHLEKAGVETDARGFITIDEHLKTTTEGIYAIGDCAHDPPFTHISYDDFRILHTNLIEGGNRTKNDRYVPYTVFIDPQLGRIGRTEREAKDKGIGYKVAKMDMTHVARALETGESRGFMKVLIDTNNNQILGCAILGMEGGELMAMIEIAMMGKLPYTTLRDGIFAHPTLAESFNNLFSGL